jgi:[FeFe] hydrogenase H-cluster maturation GTPase HydF
MNSAPRSLRLQIGLFGRTNVGKSTFMNLIAGQDVSIVSDQAGTTTDVVEKSMELLPLGPIVILDTGGLDDPTKLADARKAKTLKVMDRCDIVVLITDNPSFGPFEIMVEDLARAKEKPLVTVASKADLGPTYREADLSYNGDENHTHSDTRIAFKDALIQVAPKEVLSPPPLMGDLIPSGGIVVLVVPIDLQAPKGRLILPQVSAIRDILDHDAITLVVKEREYRHALDALGRKPDLVVCDSQVVMKVVAETPADIPCTTFSILFSRLKGDLSLFAQGAASIDRLISHDRVLIAESCSHHVGQDDIGTVKIPRWLRQYTGLDLQIEHCHGRDFPDDLKDIKLVIQCGGCMQNRQEMLSRINKCNGTNVAMTNYGVCISTCQGVIERVLAPFPSSLEAFKKDQR